MSKIFGTISIIFAIIMTLFVPADVNSVEVKMHYQVNEWSDGETEVGFISFIVKNNTGKFISDPELEAIEKKEGDSWVDTEYQLDTDFGFQSDNDSFIVSPEATGADSGLLCNDDTLSYLPAGEYRLIISYTVFKLRSEKINVAVEFTIE